MARLPKIPIPGTGAAHAAAKVTKRVLKAAAKAEHRHNQNMHNEFVRARSGGTLYEDHSYDVPRPKKKPKKKP